MAYGGVSMNRLSGRVLDALKKNEKCFAVVFNPDHAIDGNVSFADLARKLKQRDDKLYDQLRFLEQEGYLLKLTLPHSRKCLGYRLTDKGAVWRDHVRQARKQYLLEKWIDLFALLVSVFALILSITSLVLGQQPQP